MIFEIIIENEALEEILEAYEYYEEQQEGLGIRFQAELNSCIKKIQLNPRNYSKISKEIRQVLVERFPFLVVYEIVNSETIIVYAVFHKSRSPKLKLKKR